MKALLVLSTVLVLCGAVEEREVSVETPVGVIKGFVGEVDVFGEPATVETYLGIPFAEAPVGERRFQKPVPKAPFSEPYSAKKFGSVCLAYEYMYNPWKGSEDCLFLNVYVPRDDGGQRQVDLPVMVWIHGGGFINGASNIYQLEKLSSFGNVIVVTLNYRLAVFGFYSTGDESAPGNYGLWDQHLAIKWVHDNIQGFGGDPGKITIFGESAGSASVIYQCLFDGNKGLFQRAIAQSGSVTSSWALVHWGKESAIHVGNMLGCNTSDTAVMTECIRYMSALRINETINDPTKDFFKFRMPMGPSVDGEFVKESPWKILNPKSDLSDEGRAVFASVDLLIGLNDADGAILLGNFSGFKNPEEFEPTRELFSEVFIPMAVSPLFKNSVPESLKDALTPLYLGPSGDSLDLIEGRNRYLALATDLTFGISTSNTVSLHAKLSSRNTFLYNLFAKPSHNLLSTPSWVAGANHADDLLFMCGFTQYLMEVFSDFFSSAYKPTDWEIRLSKAIMTAWSNFAKTGDPNSPSSLRPLLNVDWPAYDLRTQRYYNISRDMTPETGVGEKLHQERMDFWMDQVDIIIEDNEGTSVSAPVDETQSCHRDGDCPP